jgi:SAM-dependent methyltransferase
MRPWVHANDTGRRGVAAVPARLEDSFARRRVDALEAVFRFLRRFRPVRERVTIGEYDDHVEREHLARYRFAARFCAAKRVADIACGTGYGTAILGGVAASVDAYDREPLCGNRIIDLEKDAWADRYDVIVSFETIEHLANPEFFLANARRTTNLLIVSTPIGEFKGYNPHHKQVWTLPEFQRFIAPYFRCDYYFQDAEQIADRPAARVRFLVAVGTPTDDQHAVNQHPDLARRPMRSCEGDS